MLEVSGLRMVFPNGHEALADISFTVPEGQFVCIIGRSGAGKSTLLRCLNGVLSPTSGRVHVAGVDVTAASEREKIRLRRHIGFVFQEYNLVGRLPVLTNVLVGRLGYTSNWRSMLGLFSRRDRAVALEALARVRL
ncbi:MAG TPA: ATP-binding cassette domain-containing protein, partial [Dehalococcoidia bacterium]|nr:ATP-binding cassette domain-containing protein [Dehalococcoidia bacterium]